MAKISGSEVTIRKVYQVDCAACGEAVEPESGGFETRVEADRAKQRHLDEHAREGAPAGDFRLTGYDAFSDEWYSLGEPVAGLESTDGLQPSYPSRDAALEDAKKQLRELERTQPSASSGGQAGIQDQVFIVHPDGHRERVFG